MTVFPTWIEVAADGRIRIKVAAQPGAKKTTVSGVHDGCLKIKIAAPPVEGAANDELIAFLAERLHVKQKDVTLVSGQRTRRKTFQITAVDAATISSVLGHPL